MTPRQARDEGLRSASWSRRSDEAKIKAKAIRDQGFRAVMVTENGPRSTGVYVYAEEKYFIKEQIDSLEKVVGMADFVRAKMKADYERTLAEYEATLSANTAKLAELREQFSK